MSSVLLSSSKAIIEPEQIRDVTSEVLALLGPIIIPAIPYNPHPLFPALPLPLSTQNPPEKLADPIDE
ncbi:hypothetical protein D9C73_020872 [Collichthys lucidus]|uniref:Uncharacterized protein n=1 Tax=Collichthys lucidus TaxID=240159 RepID=A0A4U5VEX8_COLLU|nr:hypothetical protein D9C73_020872 [Collichthys lucidus]